VAIQDYSSLQTAVASWLSRADLTANIPDFIQLAEGRMNNDLSCYQMLTSVTDTMADGLIELPSDFSAPVRLTVSVGGYEREIPPIPSAQAANDRLASQANGYVLEGAFIRVIGGQGADSYTLVYYANLRPLSEGVNWLISAAPNLYLYATLLEATPFIQDDSRISIWVGAYKAALDALNNASDDARFSPSSRMRVSGMRTP
jgi:hypothetical protein